MFSKPVSKLEFEDITDLVLVRKEPEGMHLDYKQAISKPDRFKKEITKDISAFANGNGGYLIFGITDDKNIVGIDRDLEGKSIVEWINQVLSSNLVPHVFYHDPKQIDIPNSDKIILVIHTPESMNKPHHHIGENSYYVRINDRNQPANHYQIRDMFEFSKNRIDEVKAFLKAKNVYSPDDLQFCENINSNKLYNDLPELIDTWDFSKSVVQSISLDYTKKPLVLFSIVPKNPNEKKLNDSLLEFKIWLEKNNKGFEPRPGFSVVRHLQDYETKLDGFIFKNELQGKRLLSYFEISDNGYLEAGFSNSISFGKVNILDKTLTPTIAITSIVGYLMALLGFAKKFYNHIRYYDEVLIQLNFANVLDYKLYLFHEHYNMWEYNESDKRNNHHASFKLSESVIPTNLDDQAILALSKNFSENICRAFGLPQDCCFDGNTISWPLMENIFRFHNHKQIKKE